MVFRRRESETQAVHSQALQSVGVVVEADSGQIASNTGDIPEREGEQSTTEVGSTDQYRSSADSMTEKQVVDGAVSDNQSFPEKRKEEINSSSLAVSIIAQNSNLLATIGSSLVEVKGIFSGKIDRGFTPAVTITRGEAPIQLAPVITEINRNPTAPVGDIFTEDLQLLKKVEVFRGFTKTRDDKIQIKDETWEVLTKELYDEAEGRYLLCRMSPYDGVKTSRGTTLQNMTIGKRAILPIFNEYFIIVPPKNSNVFQEPTPPPPATPGSPGGFIAVETPASDGVLTEPFSVDIGSMSEGAAAAMDAAEQNLQNEIVVLVEQIEALPRTPPPPPVPPVPPLVRPRNNRG